MPKIIIPDLYCQVAVHFHPGNGGKACVNVFGVSLDSHLDQTAVDGLSDDLADAYKDWLASPGTYDSIRVLENNGGDLLDWQSTSSAGSAAGGADVLPPNVMAMVDKKTGLSGRKFRGRTFLPDLNEGNVSDNGTLNGTALTALQAWADAVTTAFASGVFLNQVLLHTNVPGPDPSPTPLVGFTANSRVATLKSRYVR